MNIRSKILFFVSFNRKNAIGKSVGRIILTSLDFIKPDLSHPLTSADLVGDLVEDDPEKAGPDSAKTNLPTKKKAQPLVGFQHFQVNVISRVCLSIIKFKSDTPMTTSSFSAESEKND